MPSASAIDVLPSSSGYHPADDGADQCAQGRHDFLAQIGEKGAEAGRGVPTVSLAVISGCPSTEAGARSNGYSNERVSPPAPGHFSA